MTDLPADLASALDDLVRRYPPQTIAAATARLIEAYRTAAPGDTAMAGRTAPARDTAKAGRTAPARDAAMAGRTASARDAAKAGRTAPARDTAKAREGATAAGTAPVLRAGPDVAAYAAYRMPATYAAVRAALIQVAAAMPGFRPRQHVDLGAGTGAAVWAAAEHWASIDSVSGLDQAPAVLDVARTLTSRSSRPSLRAADWRLQRISAVDPPPPADLVTLCYVLGEITPAERTHAVAALSAATVAVVVEPGTPAGYQRVLAARDLLLDAGMTVVAPCPHQRACPLPPGRDWCHFGARLGRTAAHRRAKGGTLGYEDEKFSYLAATRAPDLLGQTPTGDRVLRRPTVRKGLVALRLCTSTGTAEDAIVSKRQGDRYRAARDIRWGDSWPPPGPSDDLIV
jgi:ribosomal protein RSM22 (predicted rRNA methylase)